MLFGILSCQESKLSCIARSLDEKSTLKKVIERLSRNLKSFESGGKLFENYLNTIKGVIGDKSILVIDGGDITKNCATKMEGIALVRDGSTDEYRKGYCRCRGFNFFLNNMLKAVRLLWIFPL